MIEIRAMTPGSMTWMVQDFDDFMTNAGGANTYVVRNQKEKDVIDGYSLIYGSEIHLKVGEHKVDPFLSKPQFFLWVVEIEELS